MTTLQVRALPGDRGETLIETLIALMFVGLAVSALLGVVITGSTLSSNHRDLTSADVAVKRAAESVKDLAYVPGACGSTPTPLCASSGYGNVGMPGGYSLSVTAVQCPPVTAGPSSYDASALPACTTVNDDGLQLVTLVVTSPSSEVQERTQIMKRKA